MLAYNINDHTPVTYGPGVFYLGENMDRIFLTIEEQINKLNTRGLDVSGSGVKDVLEMENYYNVVRKISGQARKLLFHNDNLPTK